MDVSYGGENGFNQAIELSAELLANVKFIQEKKLIGRYFDEISQDTGKYVFGVDDTLQALQMGAVEILIVWENLEHNRYTLKVSRLAPHLLMAALVPLVRVPLSCEWLTLLWPSSRLDGGLVLQAGERFGP